MSYKCLVVDDSAIIRKVIRRMLEGFSYEVGEAENGQIALDECLKSMPDLIMLDWNMPVMTGIEFLKALRATPGGDTPKVILCTTENEFSRIAEAMSEGANEYVMKPFTPEIIKEKLQMIGLAA